MQSIVSAPADRAA